MNNSLSALRFVMIAKNLNQKELAQYFLICQSGVSDIFSGKREINKKKLLVGLNNLNVNYSDYLELEALSYELQSQEIPDLKKYEVMLIKAIGVINPKLKEECEEFLDNYYRNNSKGKKINKINLFYDLKGEKIWKIKRIV